MTPLGWILLVVSGACFVIAALLGMRENDVD